MCGFLVLSLGDDQYSLLNSSGKLFCSRSAQYILHRFPESLKFSQVLAYVIYREYDTMFHKINFGQNFWSKMLVKPESSGQWIYSWSE